jgi:hypothetical protein
MQKKGRAISPTLLFFNGSSRIRFGFLLFPHQLPSAMRAVTRDSVVSASANMTFKVTY